jgi:hypothetical protein
MITKAKLIEAVCGVTLREEFKHLPTEDLEHSMVADTPEVLALLAEKITEDQNELELKKLELNNKLELDKARTSIASRQVIDLERVRADERVRVESIRAKAQVSHHRCDVLNRVLGASFVGGSILGVLYLLLPWGI